MAESDTLWSEKAGQIATSTTSKQREIASGALPSLQSDLLGNADGASDTLRKGAFLCDADEILARAQGISLGYEMDDFLHLDDYDS